METLDDMIGIIGFAERYQKLMDKVEQGDLIVFDPGCDMKFDAANLDKLLRIGTRVDPFPPEDDDTDGAVGTPLGYIPEPTP